MNALLALKKTSLQAIALPVLGVVATGGSLRTATADPAVCTAEILRYASSTNRLYIENGATCDLEDIAAIRPNEVQRTEAGVGDEFLLRATLIVAGGSTLNIHGPDAGGAVGRLKLLSNNQGAEDDFVFVRAEWGRIHIDSTFITSWDEHAANGAGEPDTEHETFGRAFIQARSYLEGETKRESRLDVYDSEIAYLGYDEGQSSGLAWKVSSEGDKGVLTELHVYGDLVNSLVHHNYFGMYSWGAYGLQIIGNEVYSNTVYGLDPHDDSDFLIIEDNYLHHNGSHGLICSKRCNDLVIRGNRSSNNGDHGIMLHHQVDDSVVENNELTDNGGAGIDLFDSNWNIVRTNVIARNGYGIRLSVGASENLIEGNIITDSTEYGIYTFMGSNPPTRNNGLPADNLFVDNLVARSGSKSMRLKDGSGNRFENNLVDDPDPLVDVEDSPSTVFRYNRFSAQPTSRAAGPADLATHVEVVTTQDVTTDTQDAYSTISVVQHQPQPVLGSHGARGNPGAAFSGGISTDGGATYTASLSSEDRVSLKATIDTGADAATPGALYLVANTGGRWAAFDGAGWAPAHGEPAPFAEYMLMPATRSVDFTAGKLAPGDYALYLGYETAGGLVYSDPILFMVTAAD
jgi:poly(beta-D-mannuronate) C5 epimerase